MEDEIKTMNIYLVRHGQPRPAQTDSQRPLSSRGRTEVADIAKELTTMIDTPIFKIIHSGILRASQTAQLLNVELDPSGGVEAGVGLMPGDDVDPWVEGLKVIDKDLMLVGHMPFMSELRSALTGGPFTPMMAGEVVCISRDSGGWVERWNLLPG